MKKPASLKSFLKRKSHFVWDADDLEHHSQHESILEYTHDNPRSIIDSPKESTEPKEDSESHKDFLEHHKSLSKYQKHALLNYKGYSQRLNRYLRDGDDIYRKHFHKDKAANASINKVVHEVHHPQIEHLDHVTNHSMKGSHTVYRSGLPKDETKFPVGHEFTDHGYTGTTFKKSVANGFADNNVHHKAIKSQTGRKIIHVIHTKPGDKGHFLDIGGESGMMSYERELLLHRGTRFKVTHHTQDNEHHYIHSKIVANHAKPLDVLKKNFEKTKAKYE